MILTKLCLLSMSLTAAGMRVALTGALVSAFGVAALSQQTTPANPTPPSSAPDAVQEPATAPAAAPASSSPAQDAAPQPATAEQPAQDQAAPTPAGSQTSEPAGQPPAVQETGQPANQATDKPAAGVDAQASLAVAGGGASGEITEEQLKQMLVGKDLFLRGGYLGDSISFNEHGRLNGHALYGSYTLCGVRIDKLHLSKHKLELEGARYGLHFLGALPYEDPTKAVDRVKITPKKKVLRLTIDREVVVKEKKAKESKPAKGDAGKAATGAGAGDSAEPAEMSDADQLKAEIAATPESERPADLASLTTTTSPAHAKGVLLEALNNVFAEGIDERMTDHMPKFWKLYYQAVEAKSDYSPADPAVMRQTTVDQKAKLTSTFEPDSNEYAQAAGVAGMALYHVVVGGDGKPEEIAVARPIGFGLDENAVESIGKASFSPAVKDGKPVPVLLDLVVQFRIYSKRTAVVAGPEAQSAATGAALPGPYSVAHP
ncbi:MAG: energy transducer TonB [Terracidiphilus sp.]